MRLEPFGSAKSIVSILVKIPVPGGCQSQRSKMAATSPQTAQEAVERALGECEHRSEVYQQMTGFPENLEEWTNEWGQARP